MTAKIPSAAVSSTSATDALSASATTQPQKTALPRHWIVLAVSAVLEAVWALSLDASRGFSLPLPTTIFVVALVLSMVGLGYAMRGLPVSIAYAIWTGAGAALTVAAAMVFGNEPVSALKVVFLVGIIGCVIGLKFTKNPAPKQADPASEAHAAD